MNISNKYAFKRPTQTTSGIELVRIHNISPGFTNHRLVSHKDVNLQSAGHAYSTRSIEYSYTQQTAIRDYYKYSFYQRTITEWSKLPRDIALSNSLAAFKNAISNI